MGGQTPIERITKATANRDLQRRAGASAEHLQPFGRPGPPLRTEPADYERCVTGFLARALR
jgi:hypothetical protein